MIPVDSRPVTITNHASHAFQVMHELRQRNDLCDVTLCVDHTEFHAHRVVLAGCSPYLRAMFTNGMLESDKSVIRIHGVEPDTMATLLEFMYTGSTVVTTDNVQSLLQGASLLNIASLRNVCSQFLQLHINDSNCLGIQSFADMYSCLELEASARRYINQHFLDVVRHEEFLQLSEERVLQILQSDQLQVNRESQVYESALLWLDWDRGPRSRSACNLLQCIRLALIDSCYLENVVLRTDFVRTCAKCQNLVANAIRTKSDNSALATVSARSQPQGIFVLGGRNSTDCQLNSMERYDFLQDNWVTMGCMSVARTAVGAASLNGMIYAVGGECALVESQDDTMYLRCVEVYNPALQEWNPCAEIKVGRSFVSVCTLGGCIYALGGEDRTCSYNIVEKYTDKTDSWSFAPSMRRKRAGAGVTVCNGRIYVAGGYDKSFHSDRASVECFDPESQEWSFVAEMEKARSGLALVSIDHCLYALGGRSRYTDQYYDLAERYNTITHQWTSIAAMNTPRAWPAVAVVDNKIYAMGGFDGSNRLRSVEIYDPDTDSWTYMSNMNVCRAGCSSAVL